MGDHVKHRSIALGVAALALTLVPATSWAQAQRKRPAPAVTAPQKPTKVAKDGEEVPEDQAEPEPEPEPVKTPRPPARFELTPYGLLILENNWDSTESYQSGQGNGAIARSGAAPGQPPPYQGQNGRLSMTARNTILGFRVKAPRWHDIQTSARVEWDFASNGVPTSPPGTSFGDVTLSSSESAYLTGAGFRMRQAYAKLESPVVDILVGQTQQLLGWGPLFYPNAANNLGVPGHLFGRESQIRFSHEFKTPAINVELAAGAFRPPQRDSAIPDGQAGIRLAINPLKAIVNGDKLVPATIAVSGTTRTFRVQGYILPAAMTPPSQDRSYVANGAGVALDALVPIIPGDDPEKPGNTLTVLGEAAQGYGISDQYLNLTFGLPTFSIQQSNGTGTPINIDPGIVDFDPNGVLRAIDVKSIMGNVQYVLPAPLDNVGLSGIYSYLYSDNIDRIATVTQSQTGSYSKIFVKQRYLEAALHVFVTPAWRFSVSYCNTMQTFLDGLPETNIRIVLKVDYAF
jgi:hypothetical protein